jgi:3'(2'), 5'-bisphosphate nucleotidase
MISASSPYYKELKLAIEIVNIALKITEWFRQFGFQSYQKEDESPVTTADYAAQIYIHNKIKHQFPDDQVIAEEGNTPFLDNKTKKSINLCYDALNIAENIDIGKILIRNSKSSKRQWTVDPIDGTKGYQEGLIYAIGIGFMINNNPKVCAIAVPNYKKYNKAIFIAEKDNGSKYAINNSEFMNVKVSDQSHLKQATLCHSLHYDEPWVMDFARRVEISKFIQIDSMAKFCMIADGSADLYIKPMNKSRSYAWDFLPGILLVQEAGGIVSDLHGNKITFKNDKCIVSQPGLIASNSIIQKDIIGKLNEIN